MASTAVFLCGHLGALSVILNVFVIVALLRHRHRVLSNVFYVIVLHCALLDVVRGICLIVYGLPYFANSMYKLNLSISARIALFRGSTFALVCLRICNLLTIFNLLVFTTNEFIVIRYPLHYRRYFRRKAVLGILGCCWLISIIIGLGLLIPSANAAPSFRQPDEDDGIQIDLATLSMLMISVLCFLVLAIVIVCYICILCTIRKFKDEGWKGVQAMSRHKYIYVIGSVLIVDLLFLCPYSGIQMVAFLHINNLIEITRGSTLIRWWLQVLIGVHSVCQPLCYFRMTEFRRLACCNPRRPWNRTKSFSQINKSFANTRSQMKDEENGAGAIEAQNEPLLLKEGELTPVVRSEKTSPTHAWTRGESVRFRTYGNDFAQHSTKRVTEEVELQTISNGNSLRVVVPTEKSMDTPLLC
ncbi:unnamed protein product [Caenorhabditis bovis]|uniref:G-protein coupled receptors family 1 profile domain-containing protein n=1 Tax=Caenorhabditis bovis TaxID=2654633 RepID=A0A8S1E4T7_9PELO|nr:unnamed protein product [Caenorhabditis bovis]